MTSAAEIETACRLLTPLLAGAVVRNASILAPRLDLCVWFEAAPLDGLRTLVIATGGPERARIGLEAVRAPREAWLAGDNAGRVDAELRGARLSRLARVAGERSVHLEFSRDDAARTVIAELFGARGLWFLVDPEQTILALARRPSGKRSNLIAGATYAPPSARAIAEPQPEVPSNGEQWLRERALHYAGIDRSLARDEAARELTRRLERERRKLTARVAGLSERQRQEQDTTTLRQEGDLLLSLGRPAERGRSSITVTDWFAGGERREVELDPKLSLRENAEKRFARARRLEQGQVHTAEQLARAQEDLAAVEARLEAVVAAKARDDEGAIAALDDIAREIGPRPAKRQGAKDQQARRRYMSFHSGDGTTILVGRSRTDNDELTKRVARGNDVWLHIGGGFAGSHVVVRLDRGKTASLETLLDAAALALHFSKARGKTHAEVLYTPAKYVRKRKGSPVGAAEVTQSKTLSIRFDPDRLDRLLGTKEEL